MIAIISGDIINSRTVASSLMLKALKAELSELGKHPKDWEVFKGDYFQLKIANPSEALKTAIRLKAAIKAVPKLDVRMAVGIGNISHDAARISESNGTAFINSGEEFEKLKSGDQNLILKSPWKDFDKEINLYIRLALIAMDHWTDKAAETVKLSLKKPELSQEALGKILGIKQNAVSTRLKRAYYDEILALDEMYRKKLSEHLAA